MNDFIQCLLQSPPIEIVAVGFAIAYVTLASREIAWCWLAGIISTGIYIFICFEAKLLLESVINLFYFGMGFYGWHQWTYGKRASAPLRIVSLPVLKNGWLFLAGIPVVITAGFVFGNYFGSSLPYLDAFTTVFSLIATWMTARKIIESWLWWVVIDLLNIYLYQSRNLCLSAVLYGIYAIIAVYGYYQWKKTWRQQTQAG